MAEINENQLYVLAQCAIAITGFSGIVIALASQGRGGDGPAWGPFEKLNMWYLLSNSIVAFTTAILPTLFQAAGFAAAEVWRYSFGVFLGIVLIVTIIVFGQLRIYLKDEAVMKRATANLVGRAILIEGPLWAVALLLALTLANVGVVVPRTQFVYTGLIMVFMLLSLLHFAYFLSISSGGVDD